MNRLESIKKNMASCTDWYVDNAEFLVDMEYLLQRLEIAQNALEATVPQLDYRGAYFDVVKALDQLKE